MNPDRERVSRALLCLAKTTCWHRRALEQLEQNIEPDDLLLELEELGGRLAALQSKLAANYSKKCAARTA